MEDLNVREIVTWHALRGWIVDGGDVGDKLNVSGRRIIGDVVVVVMVMMMVVVVTMMLVTKIALTLQTSIATFHHAPYCRTNACIHAGPV